MTEEWGAIDSLL